MARPKKPRIVDGVELVDNLYPDPRKRPGYYRYLRADGSNKIFKASSVVEANKIASDANTIRDIIVPPTTHSPSRQQLAYHIPLYIAYQQRLNPLLRDKKSWKNQVYALNQFAEQFNKFNLGQIAWVNISNWWDELTFNQQKLRHAEFRKLFNWLMSQNLLPKLKYNPFTTADDRPRLLPKQKPYKARNTLTQKEYWAIYRQAGEMELEGLQVAMALSLLTAWRREDICNLRWDKNLKGRTLQLVIGKSAAQKGSARAARHAWNLTLYPQLAKVINRARELSLKNRCCPFVVSHWPKRRVWNQGKVHMAQIMPGRLSNLFAEARDATGLFTRLNEGAPPSFHEVRGLASTLYRVAGYKVEEIQDLMAHESKGTTLDYQDEEALPFTQMDIRLSDDVLGGEF
ncbi:tyrosine-type recombinase/integrase [uncultured Microbulbifer sp.]|uniref:tyrosine-type recombinase/integrase n=1 Tax=uncultured Microbulbifer sp. TaxID=348147 RepID=UPI0026205DAC|nr:tyrosine-type recombinase/integrase [uncultured Microbulbifer sp.]